VHGSDSLRELQLGELLSGDIVSKIQPPTREEDIYFYCLQTNDQDT